MTTIKENNIYPIVEEIKQSVEKVNTCFSEQSNNNSSYSISPNLKKFEDFPSLIFKIPSNDSIGFKTNENFESNTPTFRFPKEEINKNLAKIKLSKSSKINLKFSPPIFKLGKTRSCAKLPDKTNYVKLC